MAPVPAFGQVCEAPDGESAIEQYCETVPTPGGDRGADDPEPTPPLDEVTRRELAQTGPDGADLGGFASQGTPGSDEDKGPDRRDAGSGGAEGGGGDAGGNPSPLSQSATDSGPSTNGPLLVAAFVALALALGGAAFLGLRIRH